MKVCPITSKAISEYSRVHSVSYSVDINGKKVYFQFCEKCFYKIDFDRYRGAIFGLILNGKLDPEKQRIHWDSQNKDEFDLKKFLDESNHPKTPKEKFDNFLLKLFKHRDGRGIINYSKLLKESFVAKCYFNSFGEAEIYLKSMDKRGFVEYSGSLTPEGGGIYFPITYEGLNYIVQLEENGSESKKCFIAMAFDSRTLKIREAIKNAIIKTGFRPVVIDEENIDSDQTINDAIIAGIKNSKFCISDFSYHRNGVYFESGFALGLGKPVIYCCSEEEFSKAHFDIKPLQHIIYKSEDELEKRLIDKIEAWIK
ncbi:hypothetical protein [Seonamhaeicola sp.]|uniref:hypothetical protein n=1 Tax=Seonamhaeicola sp. TaxID=1912245 RepID=UPI002636F3B7|nr:hypothetical protein [Seonamhaeicola sp.]